MADSGTDPLTSLNCGMLHLRPAQRIVDLNDALANWRGLSRDEIVGNDLDMLLSRGSWIYWDTSVEPRLEQQGHTWDLALKLKNERGAPVEVLVNARRDEQGTRCILFPFSGRLLWERRLRAAEDRANKQQIEIERLQKIQSFRRDFINAIAHELKTPMTPIQLGLHILQRHLGTPENPDLHRSLEIVRSNLDRLSTLTRSIIQSADVAAGRLDMKIEPIEWAHFLPEIVLTWREAHHHAGPIELDVQDAVVPADKEALTTCVENLLDNAVKFSPSGAVVKLQAVCGPPAQIVVQDQGRGIEPERLSSLGRPFVQAHDRSQVTTLGMGLGLHIVTGLMEAQGGRFAMQSEGLGRGSRAILEFPGVDGSREKQDAGSREKPNAPS